MTLSFGGLILHVSKIVHINEDTSLDDDNVHSTDNNTENS